MRFFWVAGFLLWSAVALAQGLPADDEVAVPGAGRSPAVRPERPAARESRSRPGARRVTRRRPRGRGAREGAAPADSESTERSTEGLPSHGPDESESRSDETARSSADAHNRETAAERERERESEREEDGETEGEPGSEDAATSEDDAQREAERERALNEERLRRDREEARARAEERARERRGHRQEERQRQEERALSRPPILQFTAGVLATTREQIIDDGTGNRVRFAVTPFASGLLALTLTPLSRLHSGPRGLGVEAVYDRAVRIEASVDGQALAATADHFSVLGLYDFELPGHVVLGPRVGYDLSRWGLQDNDVLSGIVYESIALGAQARIPLVRDRLRIRFGTTLCFLIGLGEATLRYGASGSSSGFVLEGGVDGRVSSRFGYFALLRHQSYSARFNGIEGSETETKSDDGVLSGVAGAQLIF